MDIQQRMQMGPGALGPGALAWAGVLGAGGAAGGITPALIWWALSAANDPAVRETAITAITIFRIIQDSSRRFGQ